MTFQDPNAIEALLQQAKLKHQQMNDDLSADAQQSPTDDTDDLLAQLKQNHQNQPSSPPEDSPESQLNLQGIRLRQQQKKTEIIEELNSDQTETNDLLKQLKSQHQPKEESAHEYKVTVQEICRTEQEKQQQTKRLTEQAQTWLKELDPYSDEGFWFEQFAKSYQSRLDAAIDYLSALET